MLTRILCDRLEELLSVLEIHLNTTQYFRLFTRFLLPNYLYSLRFFAGGVWLWLPAGRGCGSRRGRGSQDRTQGRVPGTFSRSQALTVSGGEAGLSSADLEEENKDVGCCGLWAADTKPLRARGEMTGTASTSDHFPSARLCSNFTCFNSRQAHSKPMTTTLSTSIGHMGTLSHRACVVWSNLPKVMQLVSSKGRI